MKAFEELWEANGGGICGKKSCKEYWEAALEWVLRNRAPYYDIEDKKVVATDSDIIYRELESK